jgi:hypothetical protein
VVFVWIQKLPLAIHNCQLGFSEAACLNGSPENENPHYLGGQCGLNVIARRNAAAGCPHHRVRGLLEQTQIRKKGPVHMYGGLVTDET